jgi:hypothetical protein
VNRFTLPIIVLVLLVALAAGAMAGANAAPSPQALAAAKRITPRGVGGVKLGKTFKRLRRQRLVGKIRHGCELGGPRTRSAPLRSPLEGTVDFTLTSPRRASNIAVIGGAKARGVGIGAAIDDIKAAYPKAKVIHATEETFAITLVKIPKGGGGLLHFAVDTKSGKVTMIGVPYIPFCE